MAKRTDIKKILIIGSGPIVIGQAAEFDYRDKIRTMQINGAEKAKKCILEGYVKRMRIKGVLVAES